MNARFYEEDETQIEYPFEKCTSKSKFDPELMKCGKVFLCFISEDFIFFCGLCENTTCKYTIFDEFANHIREKHIMLSNIDEPYNKYKEMHDDLMDEKESAAQQALAEFEIEYLNSYEDVEKMDDKESLNEPTELYLDDESYAQTVCQPKEFLLQWPDRQVFQFIDLYREQECLWNTESKMYHKNKVKDDAYQEILQKFNELNPNVLEDTSSVKNAIKELVDIFSDFGEEQQQKTENKFYSNHEIYRRLLFLKNVPKSAQNKEAKHVCDNFQKDFTEAKSDHNSQNLTDDCKNCPICRVSFENTKDLKIHLSDLSTNLQKKICDICGAKFKDRSNFIAHLRRHKNEKTFVCQVCLKGFVTSTELKSHAVVHSDEMPFICETCGLRFKYLNRLETHKLLHGDPLFECKDCNMKFLLKRQLIYHQRKHGPAEMVSCVVCGKIFRNKDSLLRHERKIHNIRKRRSNLV